VASCVVANCVVASCYVANCMGIDLSKDICQGNRVHTIQFSRNANS
jgi:hypothetical protein